jgi:hypothetical protein
MLASGHEPFSPSAPEPEPRNWTPIIAGLAVVAVIIAAIVLFTRLGQRHEANLNDPYLAKLQLSNLHMATAQNFAGSSVTYIEGTLTNSGDRKVTGARALVIFKNSLGEITQKEPLPVTVLIPNSPYIDYGTLDRAPLAPGQSRDFRLTLEYITPDWDGQIPQVTMTTVAY